MQIDEWFKPRLFRRGHNSTSVTNPIVARGDEPAISISTAINNVSPVAQARFAAFVDQVVSFAVGVCGSGCWVNQSTQLGRGRSRS